MPRELSIGRARRGLLTVAACIGLLVFLPSCGTPSDPSPRPPVNPPLVNPPPPPSSPPPPIASLAIEQLTFLPKGSIGSSLMLVATG